MTDTLKIQVNDYTLGIRRDVFWLVSKSHKGIAVEGQGAFSFEHAANIALSEVYDLVVLEKKASVRINDGEPYNLKYSDSRGLSGTKAGEALQNPFEDIYNEILQEA